MKRSTVVKCIATYLNHETQNLAEGLSYSSESADELLNLLEGIGMLPPTNPGHVKFVEKSVTGGRTEYEYFDVNQWEPE